MKKHFYLVLASALICVLGIFVNVARVFFSFWKKDEIERSLINLMQNKAALIEAAKIELSYFWAYLSLAAFLVLVISGVSYFRKRHEHRMKELGDMH